MGKIKNSGADAVFLGGLIDENGAQVIKDKVAVLGPNDGAVKLLAPDGFTTQATIDESGPASKGMFMSVAGVPIDEFTGTASGVHRLAAAEPLDGKTIDPYAIYGAQSAQIVLDAIADSDGSRSAVIENMFGAEVTDGLLGSFSFNENGDPTNASGAVVGFTMYVATDKLETADNFAPKPRRFRRRARSQNTYALREVGGHCPPTSRRLESPSYGHGDGRALQRVRASSLIDIIGLLLLAAVIVWLLVKFFEDPTRFLNVAVIGVTNGAIYGLVALGYTLVYGILQLINFAHGDVFALSGLVASTMIVSVLGLDEGSSVIVIVLGLLVTLAVTMPLFALVNASDRAHRLQAAPQRAPARAR